MVVKRKISIFGIFILGLFLISFASAAGTSFDNAELIKDGSQISSIGSSQVDDYYKFSMGEGKRMVLDGIFEGVGGAVSYVKFVLYNENREVIVEDERSLGSDGVAYFGEF